MYGSKPKGLYDSLLCEECEAKIKLYEDYANSVFFAHTNKSIEITECTYKNGQLYYFENLDYKKTKLFVLSVLWRMSVSSLLFCKSIKLGDHEEKLRGILYNDTLLNRKEYAIILVFPMINNELTQTWIFEPNTTEKNNCIFHHLIFGGLLFIIALQPISEKLLKYSLNTNGTWLAPFRDIYDIHFLKEWLDANPLKDSPEI